MPTSNDTHAPTLNPLTPHSPERLSKVVMRLVGCSRSQAEQYIAGGWVSVDGVVVEEPYFKVLSQHVTLAPNAQLTPLEPVTILLHKAAGLSMDDLLNGTLDPSTRWANDVTQITPLKRHFQRLTPLLPLEKEASGLVLVSQDQRIIRKVDMDAEHIEQEYNVEVDRGLSPLEMRYLQTGSHRAHSAVQYKVSWQNESHLRFAIKGAFPGQIAELCKGANVRILSMKRLRLGRIPLSSLPAGYWRYAAQWERI